MFVTSQGSAYSRFERALARRNLLLAWTVARNSRKVTGSGSFGLAVVISILTRRLREGKTLEDFRAA